ncbi:MAG: serine (or cysteine) proteinase inhibitor clade B (ovalbumin) [Geobacteraceae bacterium]|nr:MAG: serine (or cysteine) proteinase inhibitor clade B (ovalbumin) [Geobacteraceae bacterium]
MNNSSSPQGWYFSRVIAAIIVGAAIITGCGGGVGTGGTGSFSVAKSNLARDTSPQVTDADLAAVTDGTAEFALKVFPLLDTNPGDNTFFSPYSISQAFALLAPGARGTTLSQIEQTISFPLPQDRFNPAFNKLNLNLAGKTTGTVLQNGLQTPKLNNANAVWGQQGFSILPAYLDPLAVNYGAGLNLVDFMSAPETARQTINKWVEDQTNNRIQNLIPPDGVTSDTRLVLTNAMWFKANWASQFPKTGTANGSFTNRDGSSSSVPFMSQVFTAPYAQVAGCQAVDIPYAGGELSMLVIMPTPGSFDAFLSTLSPTVIGDITSHLAHTGMDFSMPKYTFTRESPMGAILQSLGMTDAFAPGRADFSGIDGNRDLFVAAVFHKAFIAVDEEGTEAAAATAINVGVTAAPSANQTVKIDHPFLFLIRDRQTGLILFMGKVVTL